MKEETGLTIEDPTLCGIKNWIDEMGTRYIVFLFIAEKFSGELASSSEGLVFWVEVDEVLNLPWISDKYRSMENLPAATYRQRGDFLFIF